MKLLTLLNVGKTKVLYMISMILSSIYCVASIYASLIGNREAITYMLLLTVPTLFLLFVVFDTSRFISFILSQKIRLLPIRAGMLFIIDVLLSIINAIFFSLTNFAILAIAHLFAFRSLQVPNFDFLSPNPLSWLFYLSCFYLLLQFFILLARAILQNWLPKFSKILVPIVFVAILTIYLMIQSAMNDFISQISFSLYFAVLAVLAMIASIWLVARFLEDE